MSDDPPAQEPSAKPPKAPDCPICGKPRDPQCAPFCSKRCADVDLHRWLKGNYVIPGAEPGKTDEEEE
jgi:uncharacterized protein